MAAINKKNSQFELFRCQSHGIIVMRRRNKLLLIFISICVD